MDTRLREIGIDLFVQIAQNLRNLETFCTSEWIIRSWQHVCSIRQRKTSCSQPGQTYLSKQTHASEKTPSGRWKSNSSPAAANHWSDPASWHTIFRDTALFIKESRSTICYSQAVLLAADGLPDFISDLLSHPATGYPCLTAFSRNPLHEIQQMLLLVPLDLCPVTFSKRSGKEVP